jgi:hypothetical protein
MHVSYCNLICFLILSECSKILVCLIGLDSEFIIGMLDDDDVIADEDLCSGL